MHLSEDIMSKILFIDVDGTLVDYTNHLPESAVTAIRKARANGHRVYICTGRSRAEVYSNIWSNILKQRALKKLEGFDTTSIGRGSAPHGGGGS